MPWCKKCINRHQDYDPIWNRGPNIAIIRFLTAIIGATLAISDTHDLGLFHFDHDLMVQDSQIWFYQVPWPKICINRHQGYDPICNRRQNIAIIRFLTAIIGATLAISDSHDL